MPVRHVVRWVVVVLVEVPAGDVVGVAVVVLVDPVAERVDQVLPVDEVVVVDVDDARVVRVVLYVEHAVVVVLREPGVSQPVVVRGGDRRPEVGIGMEVAEGARQQHRVGHAELVDQLLAHQVRV